MTVAQVSNYDPFDPPAAENADEMTRLVRALRLTDRFAIFVVTCNRADLRDQLTDEVKAANPDRRFEEIVVSRSVTSLLPALAELPVADEALGAVFVYGLESFLADTEDVSHSSFVANLNRARDSFPEYLSCPLVLWLPDYVRNGVMRGAPDFYSVRSASFVFHAPFPLVGAFQQASQDAIFDNVRSLGPTERNTRQKSIQNLLSQIESLPDIDQDRTLLSGLFDRLAGLYVASGDYTNAETLLRKATDIDTTTLGVDHPNRATSLNNLGYILRLQGKIAEAEERFREALEIHRRSLGAFHFEVGTDLCNLAIIYYEKKNYSRSDKYFNQALEIQARSLGREHPYHLSTLSNFAQMLFEQGRVSESKGISADVLEARERVLGSWHPDVATSLNNIALIYSSTGDFASAETALRRALAIDERALGSEHPETARTLFNLAVMLQRQGRITAATATLYRALEINEHALGAEDPATICTRDTFLALQNPKISVNFPNVFASTAVEKRLLTPLVLPCVRGKRTSGKTKK